MTTYNVSTMSKVLVTLIVLCPLLGNAQQTGEVEYPYLGIKFTIPDEWKGQELEEGYLMGSDSHAGFILMSTQEARSIDELKQEAMAGLELGEGTMLQLSGEFENLGKVGIGAEFEGFMEWQPARAYVIGLINPLGKGVTILSITTPRVYDSYYRDITLRVAKSIRFSKPKESPLKKEWDEALKGAKLTYMSSFGDSDYSGGYSGGSTTREYTLCSDRTFSFYYNSNFSMSSEGGGAFSDSGDNGQGRWKVETGAVGEAILVFDYFDGRVERFEITSKEDRTYLEGTRYFRTYDHGVCR